jgi:hypothetical protein
MIHFSQHSPLYLPEYTSASVMLHAGCLALLFLNLRYYTTQQNPQPLSQPELPQQITKKEPRIIMKRVPTTPVPKISQEQVAQTTTDVNQQPQAPSSAITGSVEELTEPIAHPEISHSPSTLSPTVIDPQESAISSLSLTMKAHNEIKKSQTTDTNKDAMEEPVVNIQRKIIQKINQARTVKRNKMQHSWYVHQKSSTSTHNATEDTTRKIRTVAIHEMALSQIFQKAHSTLSQAQQAAENLKREFQEAAVNDYISAIHHAIAFSLNRMRIMLSPFEMPPQITMRLSITAHGSITHVQVTVLGQHNSSLTASIKRAILQAAPFRPFPPSITTPELTLTINAYPDGSYATSGHHSSRPTPLLFTLSNTMHN